ncbi:hypothetical protein [Burkholderia sp. BDU5]|uniref:hypothetical protein n=1 Tax=Burkholderia sp. BDU5 TaxID=1385590 RepID=UPI000756B424|nr:hypothetical protein [Burkholderia sp. BDU5]KVE37607.1 hypothetical protein WS69_10820 [Burkholderia sp. BDU5]
MSISIVVNLASGELAEGLPLELLSDGAPIAKTTVDEAGRAFFDIVASGGRLAVRVDRSQSDQS